MARSLRLPIEPVPELTDWAFVQKARRQARYERRKARQRKLEALRRQNDRDDFSPSTKE